MYGPAVLVSILAAAAAAAVNAPHGLVTNCNPPTGAGDSTYSICVYPNTEAARSKLSEIDSYLPSLATEPVWFGALNAVALVLILSLRAFPAGRSTVNSTPPLAFPATCVTKKLRYFLFSVSFFF